MSDGYKITFDNKAVLDRLAAISRQVDDLSPAMQAIGETLMESTKQRFGTSSAPDGSRWAANAPSTLLARLSEISGNFAAYTRLKTKKEGRVRVGTKKGYFDSGGRITQKTAGILANKKPLIATGILQDTIRYQLVNGGNGVEVGTNRFFGEWEGGAAVHHFGSRDGKIPARPFLGISPSDEVEVLEILSDFLAQSIR